MIKENMEDQSIERTKGYVSLEMPFIYYKDEQEDERKLILTEQNYYDYVESVSDDELNLHGIPSYYLTFYEIDEKESPCSFFPDDIKSTKDNEISPLDWNIYSACCRVSKNRYIVTGGVNLQSDYIGIFKKKFDLTLKCQADVLQYKEYIKLLSQTVDGEDETEERTKLFPIFEKCSKIKQNLNDWQKEKDFSVQKTMLVDVYTQEISRIKLKTDKQQKLLDKNYCTDNDIEFRFKDNLPEQTKVFNQTSPYQSTVIEILFDYVPHLDKYEFTAKYLESMPSSRSNHQSVVHNGKLYVIGGVCKQTALKSVCVYDLSENTWSHFHDMTQPHVNFSAVSHNNYIYVLGGHTTAFQESSLDFTTLERINPDDTQTQFWQKLTLKKKMAYINHYEHQINLVSYKNQLILFGGGGTKKDIPDFKEHTQISLIDILPNNKWSISPLESNIKVRKTSLVTAHHYKGSECFYIYGGLNKLHLECIHIHPQEEQLIFEKAFDNDYTEEVQSYDSDFLVYQPKLFLD